MEWQPIETAPKGELILATDGKWFAVGAIEPGFYFFCIDHFAVCQEYDWNPIHWMPLPDLPEAA